MSHKRFTEEEIGILSRNPNVEYVSDKYIFYKADFKELCVRNVRQERKTLRQTFIDAGFDIEMIGWERIRCAYSNWTRAVKNGKELQTGHHSSGRRKKEISAEELIAKKDKEIRRLKEENEFLRQLRRLEGRYQPKKSPSEKNSNS